MTPASLQDVARLPIHSDNTAMATKFLKSGTQIHHNGTVIELSNDVLIGHRFAVQSIGVGETLLSWGQTYGIAISPIKAGDYVCNADVLRELRRRSIDLNLPEQTNFKNELERYTFDRKSFQPAPPLPRYEHQRTFMGYAREGNRGVGTRNTIVLLGVTSLTNGFVRTLETRLQTHSGAYPNIDNIVAIAHTEGGHQHNNNQDLLLRTLAGFIVHANVGAVLIIDDGQSPINNVLLQRYMHDHDYPLSAVVHQFMSLSVSFAHDLNQAEAIVTDWLPVVNAIPRTPQPLSNLKIALQCGGSDAFSGISGNPLAAWVAKEVIQYGGAANLAETDELIGAESYVLNKVRDVSTAEKFLSFVERFKQRVGWHGQSADGNPSGGNKFRGLYNIYLKSLGASTKRHPDVPLDYVIDYSEQMAQSGFYFMDSPGNDLESIAGQVASGCNMIFFVTGNGSITNFPFVPTVKIVTTSERYALLSDDMDINAGAYLDGTPLETLGSETLDYTIDIASGKHSVGEQAGHSQVQIWRNWQQTQQVDLQALQSQSLSGQPLALPVSDTAPEIALPRIRNGQRSASQQVGLILPTSLCSGQIARMCVEQLNQHAMLETAPISRFVTLVHTEGCGSSINQEFNDTLLGYLGHPSVRHALLLEHGCEATHNDYFRNALLERGYSPDQYGWASIQREGGIKKVLRNIEQWFLTQLADDKEADTYQGDLQGVILTLVTHTPLNPASLDALTQLTQWIIAGGGTVLLHEHDALLTTAYLQQLGVQSIEPTVAYAQPILNHGLHIMAMPTHNWSEIITGLGASSTELIISVVDEHQLHGHPMIPMLQASEYPSDTADLLLQGSGDDRASALLAQISDTLSGIYTPKSTLSDNVYFQITRGLLGVSL